MPAESTIAETQAERAYGELRRRILISDLGAGERLKEEEWARRLALGRLAVREALTQLQGEGLLVRGERGGFYVANIEGDDVREIREVREVLEVAAVRLAKGRITPAQVKELEGACDDFEYLARKGYPSGANEADRRFHSLLIAASGNSKLRRAYEACHIPLFHVRLGQSAGLANDFAATEKEHRSIVAALREGQTEKAVRRLRAHFARGEKLVLAGARAG